ncbi:MAG: KEOPS complex subunit Pcc1 [Nitrososphaerota archaeon]
MDIMPIIECEAKIRMSFDDSSTAELVMRALQPDNEPLPRGIKLSARMSNGEIVFAVRTRRPIASLLTTLDDIIASAILALKAAQAVGQP